MVNPGSDTASCGGIGVLAHPLIRRTYSAERSVSRLTAAVSLTEEFCELAAWRILFFVTFFVTVVTYFVPHVQRPSSHDFWYDEVG